MHWADGHLPGRKHQLSKVVSSLLLYGYLNITLEIKNL